MPRAAWVVNLDAEDELARPSTATPPRSLGLRVAAALPALVPLLGPDARVLDPYALTPGEAAGCVGHAWCPTPRALARLRRAGATVPEAPSLAVLQRVNHRRFAADLGQHLPGARWVDDLPTLEALLAAGEGPWLLKRPYGYNGRGRLRVRPGRLDDRERAWVAASFARGDGLQCEPEVPRVLDLAWHGRVAPDGTWQLGRPTTQRCDAFGQWAGTELLPPDALSPEHHARFRTSTERVAAALADAGYFGPFGVDGFLYRDTTGAVALQPLSEVNARYSMGWVVGFGQPA